MIPLPRLLAAALVIWVAACSPATPVNSVQIVEPWTRATPPGAGVGAGYMKIINGTAKAVRLLGAQTAAAERVEIHAMSIDGGVMRMRPLAEGLEVPAGGEVELTPSGMHLMLIGLKRPLVEGETLAITLQFDGDVRVEAGFTVEGIGGRHGP